MLHENFARLLNTYLSAHLRTLVQVNVASVDQLTYEEFVRSMPNPSVISIFEMRPLSGNVIIEINASPWRFDLDYSYYRQALDNGLMFSINPDAHASHEIDEMKWGVLQARKASLSVRDVLNTHTAEMVASIFKTKR